ncbi:hypothetical protein [Streptomyces sp. NRRL S-813]|uniref:hypothetical protein n=1 Tax=Streptomyces sp. NRRL S-813 TaxID=1463919 RepID=UPI00131ADA0F|nr:hypothetical protein [Streptomyces sp. NRRL S-813]
MQLLRTATRLLTNGVLAFHLGAEVASNIQDSARRRTRAGLRSVRRNRRGNAPVRRGRRRVGAEPARFMGEVHGICHETAERYSAPADHVTGADIAGFERAADAMPAGPGRHLNKMRGSVGPRYCIRGVQPFIASEGNGRIHVRATGAEKGIPLG